MSTMETQLVITNIDFIIYDNDYELNLIAMRSVKMDI